MEAQELDVIVIGGGAAGLSAALVLGRSRRRVAVIDAGEPRNAPAAHMQGYLSRDGLPPSELLALGRDEVERYGVEVIRGRVADVLPGFVVTLDDGTVLRARRLLLATGALDLLPDVTGLRERFGRDVLHCPYCHGWEARDRALGVLGGVPGAAQHALLVRQWSDRVAYLAHTTPPTPEERAQLDARGVVVVDGPVAHLVVRDDALVAVALADGREVPVEAVFVRPVNKARPDALLATVGCATDAAGLAIVDTTGRTSVPGVWAAGNIVDPRLQVISSAGAGSSAAIAINADLVREDVERAVTSARTAPAREHPRPEVRTG